ncbi:MAG: type II toxin-antitoxin system VapC family toxin [Microcella sp.]
MIVLDANVLIAFLDQHDAHHLDAISLFEHRFLDGFVASVLTVAEALVHPTRAGLHDAAMASLRTIGIDVVPLEASDAATLARVRSEYRVRMPDAVALHTAIRRGAELATFDASLALVAAKAGVTVVR